MSLIAPPLRLAILRTSITKRGPLAKVGGSFRLAVALLQKHPQRFRRDQPFAADIAPHAEKFGADAPGAKKVVYGRAADGKLPCGLFDSKPLQRSGDDDLRVVCFHGDECHRP